MIASSAGVVLMIRAAASMGPRTGTPSILRADLRRVVIEEGDNLSEDPLRPDLGGYRRPGEPGTNDVDAVA